MPRLDKDFLIYSGLDSACMMQIHDAIWDDVEEHFKHTYNMTVDLYEVLCFMQTRGVAVSHRKLDQTKQDVMRVIEEKQLELNKACGRELNVNSPKDCQAYFYDECGITPYLNKARRPTVDDMALQRLARGTATRAGMYQAKLVQEIRGLQKLYSTYLDMEFDDDSRMRASYNPRGTKFGRLSSSKTVFGTGTNFQNLPQDFKKFLVPDPGYIFIEADKRQAEWVVVAYASGDANMVTAIQKGMDVHAHTASLMFNVSTDIIHYENKLVGHLTDAAAIQEIRSKDKMLARLTGILPRAMSGRQCGKKSNHGLNYDEGYRQFALLNEMDEKEGKRIHALYHRIYPGIKFWHKSIQRQLSDNRTLVNCFGRKVRFMDRWGDDLFKSAYSMIPQSTVVDSLNQGMIKIYNDEWITRDLNVDILAQVHDSILMQVPIAAIEKKENYEELIRRINEYTSPTLCYNSQEFTIATDYKVSCDNWSGHNQEHNPHGMQDVSSYDELVEIIENWRADCVDSGTKQLAR